MRGTLDQLKFVSAWERNTDAGQRRSCKRNREIQGKQPKNTRSYLHESVGREDGGKKLKT